MIRIVYIQIKIPLRIASRGNLYNLIFVNRNQRLISELSSISALISVEPTY